MPDDFWYKKYIFYIFAENVSLGPIKVKIPEKKKKNGFQETDDPPNSNKAYSPNRRNFKTTDRRYPSTDKAGMSAAKFV